MGRTERAALKYMHRHVETWAARGTLLCDTGSLNPKLCDDPEEREVGGSFQRARVCVHLWLGQADAWQRPARHCKAVVLQLKINNLKENSTAVNTCVQVFLQTCVSVSLGQIPRSGIARVCGKLKVSFPRNCQTILHLQSHQRDMQASQGSSIFLRRKLKSRDVNRHAQGLVGSGSSQYDPEHCGPKACALPPPTPPLSSSFSIEVKQNIKFTFLPLKCAVQWH